MRTVLLSLFFGALSLTNTQGQTISPTNNILYVKKGATGNGSSWNNAVGELADALKWAAINKASFTSSSPLQIWVSSGVYKPKYSPIDNDNFIDSAAMSDHRSRAFLLVPNVNLYGGFSGTETDTLVANSLSTAPNFSILSGDFRNDDATASGNNGEDAYHVVVAAGSNSDQIRMKNFRITHSKANYTGSAASLSVSVGGQPVLRTYGGGISLSSSSPIISNIFIDSCAAGYGGAISCYNAAPTITNAIIISNAAIGTYNSMGNLGGGGGGGIYNYGFSPVLKYITLFNNTARIEGGAIYNYSASPKMYNITIQGNSAGTNGGGMYNAYSSPVVINTLIALNMAAWGGAVFSQNTSNDSYTNCTIGNNYGSSGGGGLNFKSGTNTVNNCIVYGNASTTSNTVDNVRNDGNGATINVSYSIVGGSSVYAGTGNLNADPLFTDVSGRDFSLLNNSPAINAGKNSLYTGNINTDIDLNERSRLIGSVIDMGAYENQTETTLSVSLTEFTATTVQKRVQLRWTAQTETNNSGFEVQRSTDAKSFTTIGFVAGKGTTSNETNYTYLDLTPVGGNNYYRLKQINLDGTYKYSETRVASIVANASVTIYPNPVTTTLYVNLPAGAAGSFQIRDAVGTTLQTISAKGAASLSMDVSHFASGIYFWQWNGQSGKFVKQ